MIFVFSFFCLFILLKTRFITDKNAFNGNYLNKSYTTQINGFFVFVIIMNHYAASVSSFYSFDRLYILIQHINQCVVVPFLFYSGYGIFEQYLKYGNDYLKKLLTKKIPYCLFLFDIFTIIHILISILTHQNINFNFVQLLLLLIGYNNIGNLNWYLFYILLNYLFTIFLFSFKFKQTIKIIGIFLLNIVYIFIMWNLKNEEYWFYATSVIFPLGMLYSYKKDIINKFINKHYYISLCFSLFFYFVSALFTKIYIKNFGIAFNLISIFFMFFILILSKKLFISSKFLKFLGNNIFIIYNIQMIPLYLLKCIGYDINSHNYLFILPLFLIYVFGSACIFDYLKNRK